ncbi:MAG: GNAT family N-acetyltransferase [Dehalococcoidia bacterium]|nr:GNAT family N-acetyltransferase [Dehalococcoidia bacterium]
MAVIFRCVQCGRSLDWKGATPVVSCKSHGTAADITLERADRPGERALALLVNSFGQADQQIFDRRYDTREHPCVVAKEGGYVVGVASYAIEDALVTVVATAVDPQYQGSGIGGKLYREIDEIALASGATRLRSVTTNDNALSLYFHQRAGYVIDSVVAIAGVGNGRPGLGGIPLRQEIRLVKALG